MARDWLGSTISIKQPQIRCCGYSLSPTSLLPTEARVRPLSSPAWPQNLQCSQHKCNDHRELRQSACSLCPCSRNPDFDGTKRLPGPANEVCISTIHSLEGYDIPATFTASCGIEEVHGNDLQSQSQVPTNAFCLATCICSPKSMITACTQSRSRAAPYFRACGL